MAVNTPSICGVSGRGVEAELFASSGSPKISKKPATRALFGAFFVT